MTDGHQTLVMRAVNRPTRTPHPAADCYRALGYRIEQARLERDAQARLWRCFVAQRHGTANFRVCERIVDAQGTVFHRHFGLVLGGGQRPVAWSMAKSCHRGETDVMRTRL